MLLTSQITLCCPRQGRNSPSPGDDDDKDRRVPSFSIHHPPGVGLILTYLAADLENQHMISLKMRFSPVKKKWELRVHFLLS